MIRFATLLLAITLTAQAPPPPDPFATANTFAAAYTAWGHAYEQRVRTVGAWAGYDVREKRAFDQVVARFNDLRREMKLQYAQ